MATREQWQELGKALMIVLIFMLVGIMLIFLAASARPSTRSPFPDQWKSCTEMKPVPGADDGSQTAICANDTGERYEIVYRSVHKSCVPEVNVKDKRDDYQHFMCEEKWELMLRAAKGAK